MPTWAYDSYCNDNVMEYVEDFTKEDFLNRVVEDLDEYLQEGMETFNLEFIVGIGIYAIRLGKKFPKKSLILLRNVIECLLERNDFSSWVDQDKRIAKLGHEKKIMDNLLIDRSFSFDVLKKKPILFNSLNKNYYN